jgi:hypothetical protein
MALILWRNNMSLFDLLSGTKKIKKGVEIGAKPFEAKFAQYGEALKHLEKNFGAQWNRTKEVADKILNIIDAAERERLYGLCTQTDIKQLKSEYKEILIAALYTLSTESSNELQQSYVRSVQKYLDIKNPQTSFDFAGIENIDSQIAQKAIFQSCVEYLLLGDDGPAFFKDYGENLFSLFVIKEKDKEKIWGNVLQIYSATGPLGLSEKYGFVPEKSIGKGIVEVEPIDLEDEIIDEEISIMAGEGKIYRAKNIQLNADIHCEGELKFEHCVIVYNGDEIEGQIRMEKNTVLTMSHCTIIGKNNEKCTENSQRYLIEGEDKTSSLIVENCLLFECLSFAKNTETHLTNSIVRYTNLPSQNQNTHLFDCASDSDSKAVDCLFESMENEDDMSSLIYLNYAVNSYDAEETLMKYYKLDDIDKVMNVILKHFKMNDWEKFEDRYIFTRFSHPAHLFNNFDIFSKCTFKSLASCICDAKTLAYCQFINCIKIMDTSYTSGDYDYDISHCSFVNCADMLHPSYKYLNLRYCQFLNCYGDIIEADSGAKVNILYCQFYRIHGGKILTGHFSPNYGRSSKISQCIFDGIFVPKGADFISAEISKDMGIKVTIDDCEFKHCITEDPNWKIIECYPFYTTFWTSKQIRVHTIKLSNCRGLENVNKEGELTEDIVIQQETSTGQPIGARLDEATVGVPGFTQDFVIKETESENNGSNFRDEIIAEINDIKDLIKETQKTLEENEQAASSTTAGVRDILLQAKTDPMFLHNIPSEIIEGLRNELEKAKCLEKESSVPMEIKKAIKEQIKDIEEFIQLWEKAHQKE